MARVSCVFILVLFVFGVDSYDDPTERLVDDEINKLGTGEDKDELSPMRRVVDTFVSVAVSGVASTDEIFKNASVFGDNLLWKNLITECGPSTSLSCVKRNVFSYLDRTVSTVGDVAVTDSLVFERNYHAFENKYERSKNEAPAAEGRSVDTFEEVADALADKGERFLLSHDLRLQLPSVLLGGAVLRLSPRALAEGGGALLTVEPAPSDVAEARAAGDANDREEGRIFFKHAKKVFRRRLLLSLFALLLVVKLLKVAVMFILPVLLGVGTAKKIVLKVLLFLFPALAHLFKFCSYYHGLHAATKYHHHHHQIAHHHHHVPVHVPVPVHVHHDHHDHHSHLDHHGHHLDDGPSIYASAPGPSYHGGDAGGPPGHGGPWGPPPGHDYTARTELLAAAQHNENELASWGLGGGPGGVARDTFGIADNAVQQRNQQAHRLAYSAYSYLDDPRVSRSAQPVTEPTKVFPVASKASHAAAAPAPAAAAPAAQQFLQYVQPQSKKDIKVATAGASVAVGQSIDQATLLRAQQQMLMRQQQLKMLQQQQLQQQLQQHQLQQQQLQQQLQLKQQQALRIQVVTPKPVPATTVQVAYDAFYSPILQRMDNVFVGLGFNEEACRERLVCSMYKNPPKFSPHSNHISNELSRDEAELRQPAVQNSAVARFQRYVQAARDGQEQRDCLRLYPACTVNTEL